MSGMHRDRLRSSRGKISTRVLIQTAFAVLFNGYFAGFTGKKLYSGPLKAVCVPVLNCYSCPGALGACPVGSLQAVLNHRKFPFYVLGTLMLFGIIFGRIACGLLCPFGFLQDLLSKIPHPAPDKKPVTLEKADRAARYIKYFVLALLVFILPAFGADENGILPPWFCKYLCPAGTLEGGVFQMMLQPELRTLAGAIFNWKMGVLAVIVVMSIFIRRPFCRYLCPLGALYSLFNRFSFYRMTVDMEKCVGCGRCETVCPMAVKITSSDAARAATSSGGATHCIDSGECIRCGKCREICPVAAVRSGFKPVPGASGPEGKEEMQENA